MFTVGVLVKIIKGTAEFIIYEYMLENKQELETSNIQAEMKCSTLLDLFGICIVFTQICTLTNLES